MAAGPLRSPDPRFPLIPLGGAMADQSLRVDDAGQLRPSIECRTCGALIARAANEAGGHLWVYADLPMEAEPDDAQGLPTYFLRAGMLTSQPVEDSYYKL